MLTQEGIEFRPPCLAHGEVAQLTRFCLESLGVPGSGRAVEVEEAADVDVTGFACVEAMEYLGLHAGEEVRHCIARSEDSARRELAHVTRRLEPRLIGTQLVG